MVVVPEFLTGHSVVLNTTNIEGVQEVIDRLSTVQAGWSEMLELESAVA